VSFVGIVPFDAPRWVIYVGVGRPNKEGSGGTIVALVSRLVRWHFRSGVAGEARRAYA
jgi:hypothetical protein